MREVQAKLGSGGACAALTAFAHEVEAQRGKKLSVALADKLLAEVAAIRAVIPC